jgi:hypothetical protein
MMTVLGPRDAEDRWISNPYPITFSAKSLHYLIFPTITSCLTISIVKSGLVRGGHAVIFPFGNQLAPQAVINSVLNPAFNQGVLVISGEFASWNGSLQHLVVTIGGARVQSVAALRNELVRVVQPTRTVCEDVSKHVQGTAKITVSPGVIEIGPDSNEVSTWWEVLS